MHLTLKPFFTFAEEHIHARNSMKLMFCALESNYNQKAIDKDSCSETITIELITFLGKK